MKSLANSTIGSIIERLTETRDYSDVSRTRKDSTIFEPEPTVWVPVVPADMFTFFAQRGWTDGLPVIPPTREAVLEMIGTCERKGDETVGIIPPLNGRATIEKLAANAVMAGCLPAYFPVILAAIKAMLQPRPHLAGIPGEVR